MSLIARGLTVSLQRRPILESIDLDVAAGEVVSLLGPNGSGKSTLIRALAGLIPIDHGSIEVAGRALADFTPREIAERIAVVPQEEPATFGFTVREIVTMGRIPISTGLFDTDEDRRVAQIAIEEADCAEYADRPITTLSGGERQRALIARALAQGSGVILLDEPTSHLDAEHQLAVVRIVRALAAAGRAVLVALHDLNIASRVSDRSILLQSGRVVMAGATDEVLSNARLEDVYRVGFERVRSADGGLIVVPSNRVQ